MKQWKRWAGGVVLVGAGLAAGLVISSGRGASTTASLIEAWQEAFGGRAETVVAVSIAAQSEAPPPNIEEPVPVVAVKKPVVKKANKPTVKAAAKPKLPAKQGGVPMVNGTSTTITAHLAADSCDVSRADVPRGNVIMNEIAWMGSGGNPLLQWIEFRNMSKKKTADLAGWKILDRDGAPVAVFVKKTSLAPGKTTVLAREAPEEDPFFMEEEDDASKSEFPGMLSRHGGWLKLFNAECALIDELVAVDGWPGGDLATGATLERKPNRGWQTSAAPGGTPKKENSAGFTVSRPVLVEDTGGGSEEASPEEAPLPASAPVIAAVHTTGGAGMTDHDAVKLYNPNDAPYPIGGWKMRKRTKTGTESSVKTFAEGSAIPARGYFVWANAKFTGITADATSTATLSDDNSVALLNKEDEVVDAIAWGSGHANLFVEGAAYPENPGAGEWLGRKIVSGEWQDTNVNTEDFELP